jgi:tryptophan-rich sensory protein
MVLFETFLTTSLLNKNSMSREYPNEELIEEKKPSIFSNVFGIVFLIIFIIYGISLLFLWGRMVMEAFKCSTKQGVASIFLPVHYNLYKFADLISISCKNNQFSAIN